MTTPSVIGAPSSHGLRNPVVGASVMGLLGSQVLPNPRTAGCWAQALLARPSAESPGSPRALSLDSPGPGWDSGWAGAEGGSPEASGHGGTWQGSP